MKISYLLALILFLSIFNITGCRQIIRYKVKSKNLPKKVIQKKQKNPDYIIYDVKHYHYKDGKLSVVIDFKKGVYYSDGSILNIENCNFLYYDRDGKILSRGHADRAKLYMEKSFMEAWDNIKVESIKNGTVLITNYLQWYGDKSIFVTDRPVVIERKNGDRISGIGMEADLSLNIVEIKKNVRGTIKAR